MRVNCQKKWKILYYEQSAFILRLCARVCYAIRNRDFTRCEAESMKQTNYDLFFSYIDDLLADDTVQAMRDVRQHAGSVTRLSHSLFVAYLSYRICRFFDWRSVEAARGALLHDLFDYDQHDPENHKGHLRRHPFVALDNASLLFPLSPVERDAIAHHMWPLNIADLPKSKEAAVVCLSDKLCSIAEVSRLYLLLHMNRKLSPGF